MSGVGSVRRRTRGTVLVMVIGLLVMVFVMGTSYLFVARFEREVVRVELRGGAGAAGGAIDGGTSSLSGGGGGTGDLSVSLRLVLRDVLRQLRLDAVGADGIPYNDDLDGTSGSVREDAWDAPGSFAPAYDRSNPAPHLYGDGLLSANEPYKTVRDPVVNDPNIWKWFAVSSLRDNKPRLSYQPVLYNNILNGIDPEAGDSRLDLIRTRPSDLTDWQFYSDADGDGYPDFLFVTSDRFVSVRGQQPSWINDPGGGTGQLYLPYAEPAPDELDWESVIPSLPRNHKVALRVIGHGGMVLLDKDTPESLLLAATGRTNVNEVRLLGRNDPELNPAMEEVNLRRRFCLPPKYDPNASNNAARQVDPRTPFERANEAWLQTRDSINQSMPRWNPMPYDLAQELLGGNGNYPSGGDHTTYQRNWMTLDNNNTDYDRRHLVTTVAYDDLLRPLRNENDGRPGASESETHYLKALFYDEVAKLPYGLADQKSVDLSRNRVWMSGLLRRVANGQGYLPDEGLRPLDEEGNRYAGFTKFSLADLVDSPPNREQYLRLVYGYYLAMLQRWQPAGDDDISTNATENRRRRMIRAGALAINTWDYFDNLQTFSPLHVTSLRYDSVTFPEYKYLLDGGGGLPGIGAGPAQIGIEGLPFISMAYKAGKYDGDMDNSPGEFKLTDYAIELFNPWPYKITLAGGQFQVESGGMIVTLPQMEIPAASVVGQVNAPGFGTRSDNLAVISNRAQPGLSSRPHDVTDANLIVGKTVTLRVIVDGSWFTIDEIDIENAEEDEGGDGGSGTVEDRDEWLSPEDHEGDATYFSKFKTIVARRVTFGPPDPNQPLREWRFAVGVEAVEVFDKQGNAPTNIQTRLGLSNGIDAPDKVKPVPLWFNNSGDARLAFPTTGSLLLVNSVAHVYPNLPISTQLVEMSKDDGDDESNAAEIDNGHMPVFDRRTSQMVIIDEDDPDKANVPWGMLVFDYFTAMPLQSLRLAPAGQGQINSLQTTMQQYRDEYRKLLNVTGNQALHLPIVERTRTVQGNDAFGYGSKVRGRVNINLAPWSVLDGLPLIQSFPIAQKNGFMIPELRPTSTEYQNVVGWLTNPPDSPWPAGEGGAIQSHASGELSLSSKLAQAIVAYREGRQLELTNLVRTPGEFADRRAGLPNKRRGPGFVTVGELAALTAGAGADWRPWRIDGGTLGDPQPSYARAIAILASLADWATVRTNTYTVYATGAEVEEGALLRGQWTVDRSRCLYSSEQPEVIGPEVLVGYADAAGDPK